MNKSESPHERAYEALANSSAYAALGELAGDNRAKRELVMEAWAMVLECDQDDLKKLAAWLGREPDDAGFNLKTDIEVEKELHKHGIAPARPRRIVVVLEGGLVQEVIADEAWPIEVVVIDYDTESSSEEDLVEVDHWLGVRKQVCLTELGVIEKAKIDLDAVFGKYEEDKP